LASAWYFSKLYLSIYRPVLCVALRCSSLQFGPFVSLLACL